LAGGDTKLDEAYILNLLEDDNVDDDEDAGLTDDIQVSSMPFSMELLSQQSLSMPGAKISNGGVGSVNSASNSTSRPPPGFEMSMSNTAAPAITPLTTPSTTNSLPNSDMLRMASLLNSGVAGLNVSQPAFISQFSSSVAGGTGDAASASSSSSSSSNGW
jgi:hypothetical protein